MDMKRFFLYAIVIAALALAGCGGNGGGTTTPPVDSTPTPTPTSIDLSKLLAGYMDLGADGEHTIKAGESEPIGYGQFMCAAGGADCTVTVKDGKATYMSDSPMVTATGPSQAAQDAKDAADKAAMDMALGIGKAIVTTTNPALTNGLPGGNTSVAITRKTSGDPVIKLKNGTTGNDSVDFDPEYTMATDVTTPALTGFSGQTQMRKGTKVTDYVTIYTDIENATPGKLKYNETGDNPTTIPIISGTGDSNRSSNVVLDKDATSYANKGTVEGTLNGIEGTFTCAATAGCSVTFLTPAQRAPGVVSTAVASFSASGWKFASTDFVESSSDPDNDYMYFGYWMEEPTTGNSYKFASLYGGNEPFTPPDGLLDNAGLSKANSTATYEGKAAGHYMTSTLGIVDGEAKPVAATAGKFTADANLTAYFGLGTHTAADMQNTIGGTIDNFMDGNKKLDFIITLDRTKFVDTSNNSQSIMGTNDGDVSGLNGTTKSTSGSWEVLFYGLQASETADTTDMADTLLPSGVAGKFDADFSNGSVGGGFIGRKQ